MNRKAFLTSILGLATLPMLAVTRTENRKSLPEMEMEWLENRLQELASRENPPMFYAASSYLESPNFGNLGYLVTRSKTGIDVQLLSLT